MNRRTFLCGSLLMLAVPLAAGAQPTGKLYRIGVLETLSATLNTSTSTHFGKGSANSGTLKGKPS